MSDDCGKFSGRMKLDWDFRENSALPRMKTLESRLRPLVRPAPFQESRPLWLPLDAAIRSPSQLWRLPYTKRTPVLRHRRVDVRVSWPRRWRSRDRAECARLETRPDNFVPPVKPERTHANE